MICPVTVTEDAIANKDCFISDNFSCESRSEIETITLLYRKMFIIVCYVDSNAILIVAAKKIKCNIKTLKSIK